MLIAGTLCCFVAGILAGSKAAALLIVAAVVVVVLRRQRGRVPVRWLAAGLLLSALAAALLLPMTTLGDRVRQFVQTADGGVAGLERVVGWRSAAQIVPDFAWSGVGAGAFAEIFPAYAPSGGDLRLSHAHNDYLELLVELGIPGALLTALLMLLYFGLACRQAGRSRTRFGLLVGLCTVSLHALVDFNHQIPSIALLFVVLAALAVIPRSRVKR